ncbi:MAG TPA: SusD/RagB family nutrient-binding outer membrane lipoprotein, partial [Balneolaceae bacterium]|nr:SusD/RagB family nutrient-binding outer membrane lipoprotein [Balneolaceae bacterium]
KMRLGITLADSNPQTAKKAVESASPNAFQSNDDDALIHFEKTPPSTNPIWERLVQSGRNDFVPSNTLIDMMNNLNDPRRKEFFVKTDTSVYEGGTYGTTNTYGAYSHMSSKILARDLTGFIMKYPEIEFIRAEAAQRGYNISGSAQSHYNEAIRTDMQYWGVADSSITQYLSQSDVNYATAIANGTEMQRIAQQKYLGLYLQGLQAWTEWRRLDAPMFNPPPGMTMSDIPVRFTYPVSEQNLNTKNYNQAASAIGGDKLSTHIFWDVN